MNETENTPPLDTIPLYRYLTFNRFLETLEKGLFIPKASLFNDRWEAMVHPMHEYLRERNAEKLLLRSRDEAKIPTLDDHNIPHISQSVYEGKKEVYVSCWNGTNYECVAMWKLYGKGGNAVMLETNAKELTDAFVDFNESEKKEWLACLRKLKYVLPGDDGYNRVFDGDPPLWDNGFQGELSTNYRFHYTYTGLHYKHISYDFEHEYRLLAAHKNRGDRPNNGIILPLKKSFIKKVILKPDSSDTFKVKVRDCLNKYDFNDVEVEKSFLDELPPLEKSWTATFLKSTIRFLSDVLGFKS
jgi:hypothetical protein